MPTRKQRHSSGTSLAQTGSRHDWNHWCTGWLRGRRMLVSRAKASSCSCFSIFRKILTATSRRQTPRYTCHHHASGISNVKKSWDMCSCRSHSLRQLDATPPSPP
eukprot:571031-Rhodomonas_salina.4